MITSCHGCGATLHRDGPAARDALRPLLRDPRAAAP